MTRQSTDIRQAQIAAAAMQVIATQGVRKFTAQAVADAIDVTPGALFRHFSSMGEILDAALDRLEELLFADLPGDTGDPFARLRAFFMHRIAAIVANPSMAQLLLGDQLSHSGEKRHEDRVAEFKRRTQEYLRSCLHEAEANGQLRSGVGVEEGTVLITGAILALAHRRAGRGEARQLQNLSERVFSAIVHALVVPTNGGIV